MRGFAWLLFALFSNLCFGQPASSNDDLFQKVRPDVSIVVKKHTTGADMVEVTMLNAQYPPDLLKEQMIALGKLAGSEPRGLIVQKYQLDPANRKLDFVKATFAMDNVIDTSAGVVRVQPFLKAMTGVKEPLRVDGFAIMFAGVRPGPSTVQRIRTGALDADAKFVSDPAGLEYRILVKTETPAQVEFPDKISERKPDAVPSGTPSGPPPTLWVLVGVSGLALGVLVYLALLRGGRNKS